MLENQNNLRDERDDQTAQRNKDKNLSGMEGEGMGGHNFDQDGKSPMGDDKDNPSQNAGYTNAYLNRVAPSEEDTANNNFKSQEQQGEPDYDAAHGNANTPGPQELPDQQKVGESDQQDVQQDNGSGGQNTDAQEHIET